MQVLNAWSMAQTPAVKAPLRRSFSEHVKDSTNKAWDVFWRGVRERRLWEIEAKEACDWLREAGFPQYVHLFRDCRFPVDIEWAKRDHSFLDKDALDSLSIFRFLRSFFFQGDECDEEDFCAISPNWTYDRRARRWRRLDPTADVLHLSDSPNTPQDLSPCDVGDRHDACSINSSSSTESEGHDGRRKSSSAGAAASTAGQQEASRSCSANKTLSRDTSFRGSPSPAGSGRSSSDGCFPDKPPRKKGPSLLRTMEKLRMGETPAGGRSWVLNAVGRPGPVQEGERRCGFYITYVFISLTLNLYSVIFLSSQDYRNQINNNNNNNFHESLVFQIPQGHKPGTFPTSLAHKHATLSPIIDNTSVNWRTGSFHGYRGRHSCRRGKSSLATGDPSSSPRDVLSPLAALDHRLSVYDNVPDDRQLSGSEGGSGESVSRLLAGEDVFSALDGILERINNLQQLRGPSPSSSSLSSSQDSPPHGSSAASPCPSSPSHIHLEVQRPEEEEHEAGGHEKAPENSITVRSTRQSVQTLQVLTGVFVSCRTVPKLLRKTKGVETKGRRVFGVPLLLSVQQTGEPLPPSILRALVYLRAECLDQVGLFRKSGVKSRIQYLRELVESNPGGVSYDGQSAFDVADMVKQYFRDLPEPIFTSKLCESFLHIYQYFPKDQQLVAAQAAILLLPDENREALRTLLFFLRDVVACVDENQMTPTNLAVCLAPSLFHLNTLKRDANAASHRKYSLGRPDQRDLSENLAATQGLANMITEAQKLFQVPEPCLRAAEALEDSLCEPGGGPVEQEERMRKLQRSTQHLLKEAREKSRGWEEHPAPEHVELTFKKMDDGCPLWMWRGSVEVEAPQSELLHRLLREQELWEGGLRRPVVIQTLSEDAEVYRYVIQEQGHALWSREDGRGTAADVFLSVASEGVRVHVHSCLYLLEPAGVRKTRLTHLCRTDTRGRSPEWHGKVSGHLLASGLQAIRASFGADLRESNI
uniref:Rho-GAP domain-containing protein n=1 Tax=Mola mola TaxID=94237 RepID=A0A3Q4BKW7_MOLML